MCPYVFRLPDYDALLLAVSVHVRVAVIADGEYVRRQLADLTVLVQLDLLRGINRQYLIRINGDQDGTRVCLQCKARHLSLVSPGAGRAGGGPAKLRAGRTHVNEILVVTYQQIPQDARLMEVSQTDHIFYTLHRGGMHSLYPSLRR